MGTGFRAALSGLIPLAVLAAGLSACAPARPPMPPQDGSLQAPTRWGGYTLPLPEGGAPPRVIHLPRQPGEAHFDHCRLEWRGGERVEVCG